MKIFTLVEMAALIALLVFSINTTSATETIEIHPVGTNYKYDGWSNEQYPLIDLFGEEHVPLFINNGNIWNCRVDKLAKLVLDSDTNYTLKAGEKLNLGNSYALEAKQFNIDGNKVWLEFSKDGQYIDDQIIDVSGAADKTWTVDLDNIQNENDIVVMKVHVNQIVSDASGSIAQIDGIWLIDYANSRTLKIDDKLGAFKLAEINGEKLVFEYIDDQTAPNEIRITTNESLKGYPSIYRDKIIWADWRNGLGIYMYDLSTSEETQITTNESWNDVPAIYGDRIVWQTNSVGNWSNGDIYLYDLSTSTKTRITNDSSNQQDPAIYQDRIVWTDWRNDNGSWSNGDIYMYNFSASDEIQITTNEADQGAPDIYEDRIVWSDLRNGNSDIYMSDIATSKETQITNNEADQYSPVIYGDIIVWTDWRNGNSDIYMYDIATSEETQITFNEANQYSPDIYGDKIVWEDERNGIEDEFGHIENRDIYMYNLSTSTENRITTNTADQMEPAIYRDKIVWMDKRDGNMGYYSNPEVYMFTISGTEIELKTPTSDFSTNTTEGYAPLSIQFTDLSENATGINWDFENDGNVDSTDKNPLQSYTVPGEYTVKLIAFNANGTDSKLATVTALEQTVPPVANFSSNVTSGMAPLSVSFTDSSTGTPLAWNWDFGDGTFSFEQNPIHTYLAEGNYTVNLTSTNPNGTGSKLATITVINQSALPVFAYVPNSASNTVSIIDIETNTVTDTVSVGDGPHGVTVSPDRKKVYVTNSGSNNVSVIDTATNQVIAMVDVGDGPYGVAVSPDGEKVYVTNLHSNDVSVIDTATNQVITTVPVGDWPEGVAFTPDGKKVYVANYYSYSTISVIDPSTDTVTDTIDDPDIYGPSGIAVAPDGTKAYVTSNFNGKMIVIDTTSNEVITSVPVGYGPHGVAVGPDGKKVYVVNGEDNTISVIDTVTNQVISTVSVGNGPYGIAVSPDGKMVYMTSYQSNYVSIIETTSNQVIATVSVGNNPAAFGQFIVVPSPLHIANFGTNVTSGYAPLSVQFNDSSLNATEWFWNFGDGFNSTEQNPMHTYSTGGSYTASLVVKNGNGYGSKTATINVLEHVLPVASFSSNVTSGYAPLTVQFKDNSVLNELQSSMPPTQQVITEADNGSSISLKNGENFTLKLRENPSTGYSWQLNLSEGLIILRDEYTQDPAPEGYTGVPGTHLWIIEAVAQGSQQVNGIYKRSWENTTGTEDNFTLNVTVLSQNTASRLWDFGDGINSTEQNPTHTYSVAGNYTVALTINNSAGSNTTTKSDYIKVTADVQKSVASFTANVTSGKVPLTVKFTDISTGSPTSWKWSFGDGTSSTAKNPTHRYIKNGKYTVRLTVKNAAGSNTVRKLFYINVVGSRLDPIAELFASSFSGKVPLKVQFTNNRTGLHRARN